MMEQREKTGLLDRNGVEIRDGDIVRFYFDILYGYSTSSENGRYTEMIDHVEKHYGQWFFVNSLRQAAPAYQHAPYCEVVAIEDLLPNNPTE